MKKIIIIAGILAVLAAAAAVVFFAWRREDASEFTAVKIERGGMRLTVATTGTVKPQNRVEIKPPISGRIEELLVDEGALVRKGQILGYLSSTDRAALLDAARSKGKDEVARWEKLYNPMPIIAPVDGDVIARSVEPGQTVTANEKMFVIADRLIVQAQIDETDIGRVKRGQPAELTLDAYPAVSITGVVDQIAYDAQTVNNVTMYMVDILPHRAPPFMRSGMTANILIVTAVTNNVLILPTAALHGHGKNTVVWRSDPVGGKKNTSAKVETGMNDGKNVEIITGLAEGDAVLLPTTRIPDAKKAEVNPFMPVRQRRR